MPASGAAPPGNAGRNGRIERIVGMLVVAAFVVGVQWYFGWGSLLAAWRELPLTLAAGGLAVLLISYVVRTLRIYSYFKDRMHGDLPLCMKLTLYHNLFNYVLPMRTGELAFPILMARYFDVDVTRSVPVLVWFRILDLHTLVLAAILALPLLDVAAPAAQSLALGWLSLPWLAYRFNRRLAARLQRSRRPARWSRLIDALNALPQDAGRFLSSWAWTVANWTAKLAAVGYAVFAFADTSGLSALAAAVAGEASMVLPIHSVAATGTYEAAVAAALVAAGTPFDGALAAAINVHLFMILGVLITGLVAVAIPGRRRNNEHEGESAS